jgi:Ion channel
VRGRLGGARLEGERRQGHVGALTAADGDRAGGYVAGVLSVARRQPSAILLAAQLAGVLLYPFMEGSDVGRALFSVFGIAILGLVVLAVRSSPALTWVSVLLGIPATVLLLIQAVTGSDDLLPYSSAIEAILYFYAGGALIAYMLADRVITRDELFAVGATFTLVAWAFAYTYTVCQAIDPGSFTAAIDPNGERSWMELLFLSFTTLSSTGLSDVVPIKAFARGLVMLEQLAGLAYLALVVSRLVGLTVMHQPGSE